MVVSNSTYSLESNCELNLVKIEPGGGLCMAANLTAGNLAAVKFYRAEFISSRYFSRLSSCRESKNSPLIQILQIHEGIWETSVFSLH